MISSTLIQALDLPASSRVDQRVPKKLLLENGAPTAADKRHIREGVEELLWLAVLKSTTIGVPEYRSAEKEYLEVAVLRLTLRAAAKLQRLVELVHRAVPYPVLLVTDQGECPGLSAVHKRWSLGEAGKTVLEGEVVTLEWNASQDSPYELAFQAAMALNQQPRTSLQALYQGWLDTLLALQAARLTGTFAAPTTAEHASHRREALQEYARLEAETTRLCAAAVKEKQITRRVELNLELKRVAAAQAAARANL